MPDGSPLSPPHAEARPACDARRGRRAAPAVLLAALMTLSSTLAAQQPLSLNGRVVRQTLDGVREVAREMVTLHRVNSRDAGAIDSLVTDARGRYAFRVNAPDSQSMYLVSARYGGIAYFSQPSQGAVAPAPGEIVVYDTTSADVRLVLQGRHFVVSSPNADGVRSVIDVLEIENDTVLTLVSGAANRPTYSVLVPALARNVRASQGEQGDGAVEARDGRAELFAPLSPGLRQLVLTYELPAESFPVSVALERSVGVLEVLLEEPGARAEGGGVVSQGGVSVDGKNFTRFLGQGAPASAVLTLRVPTLALGTRAPTWLLPLVLSLITLGVIVVLARRPPAVSGPATTSRRSAVGGAVARSDTATASEGARLVGVSSVPGAPSIVDATTMLARRAATVDALLASEPAPAPVLAAALRDERATLTRDLVARLADRTRVP